MDGLLHIFSAWPHQIEQIWPGLQSLHGSAIIGVFLHEVIRIYKAVWSPLALYPLRRPVSYLFVLLVLSIISVVFAFYAEVTKVPQAIAIGFSVTTGLRALTGEVSSHDSDDHFNRDASDGRSNDMQNWSVRGMFRSFYWY